MLESSYNKCATIEFWGQKSYYLLADIIGFFFFNTRTF